MSLESQFSSTRLREADITGEGFLGGVTLPQETEVRVVRTWKVNSLLRGSE